MPFKEHLAFWRFNLFTSVVLKKEGKKKKVLHLNVAEGSHSLERALVRALSDPAHPA